MSIREVREGAQTQGSAEQIAYTLVTTPWGSSPTAASVSVYDITPGATFRDVSASCLLGTVTVVEDVITCPVLHTLTTGHTYQMVIRFTVNSNILEAFTIVEAEN